MEAEIVSYKTLSVEGISCCVLDLKVLPGLFQFQEMASLIHTLTRAYRPLEDTNGKLWSLRRLLDDSGYRRNSKFAHDTRFKINRKYVCRHRYVTRISPHSPANPYSKMKIEQESSQEAHCER